MGSDFKVVQSATHHQKTQLSLRQNVKFVVFCPLRLQTQIGRFNSPHGYFDVKFCEERRTVVGKQGFERFETFLIFHFIIDLRRREIFFEGNFIVDSQQFL